MPLLNSTLILHCNLDLINTRMSISTERCLPKNEIYLTIKNIVPAAGTLLRTITHVSLSLSLSSNSTFLCGTHSGPLLRLPERVRGTFLLWIFPFFLAATWITSPGRRWINMSCNGLNPGPTLRFSRNPLSTIVTVDAFIPAPLTVGR